MRWLGAALLALLALLQLPLWISEGSFRDVRLLEAQLAEQQQQNAALGERNRALAAEVRDLKLGGEALEERARVELGLIGPGETFFQVLPGAGQPGAGNE
jgi:cell division protein FtsB